MPATRTVKRTIEVEYPVCPICDEICECGEFCDLCMRSDIHQKHFVDVDGNEDFALSVLLSEHCEQCQDLADYISEALKTHQQILEAAEHAS